MSKIISDILQASEPQFSQLIKHWEDLSGRTGIDVRFALEIRTSLKSMLLSLGLDPKDTVGIELYHALLLRASADNKKLSIHLGIDDSDSPEAMAAKVAKFARALPIAGTAWVVKTSAVRQSMRANPPKKLMKICGLRSIDSMLKRQNATEILALGILVEAPEWSAKLRSSYKKFKVSDFDEAKAEIAVLSPKHAAALRKAGYSLKEGVLLARELGSILVIPAEARFTDDVLLISNMIIESLRERCMYGTFFRSLSTRPKFGENVVSTLKLGIRPASEQILNTSWPVLHGLAARNRKAEFQDYGPGLDFDDPEVPSAACVLSKQLPSFAFWDHHCAVMHTQHGPVSCHLSDVVMSASSHRAYEHRISWHLQANLWDELRIRYLLQEPVARKILNNGMIFQA